jgi:N-acetylmuramoyl-L-alanine amidase
MPHRRSKACGCREAKLRINFCWDVGFVSSLMMKKQCLPVIAGLARGVIRPVLAIALALPIVWTAIPTPAFSAEYIASSGRIIGDEGRARLVLDFDKEPDFEVHYLNHPPRIVIDLPEVDYRFDGEDLVARGLFNDVRFGAMSAGRSRVVLTASKPVMVASAEVIADQAANGFRFVLDAEVTTPAILSDVIAKQDWGSVSSMTTASVGTAGDVPAVSDFVVAIDAGHGGIDAGARGAKSGMHEKVITLDFARQLAESINQLPGMKAVLTRDSDVFLALSERVALARQQGAKLLVSVHADTLRQKGIRGATVYTLSDKASDRMAQALAERENKSDQIAGITIMESRPEVADILLDLTRRETQAFSVTLADSIIKSFDGQVELINNPHRYAGFQVLRAHDVPSVLLELGFLSNLEDEKLLLDADWRKKVADLLAKAVQTYQSQGLAGRP